MTAGTLESERPELEIARKDNRGPLLGYLHDNPLHNLTDPANWTWILISHELALVFHVGCPHGLVTRRLIITSAFDLMLTRLQMKSVGTPFRPRASLNAILILQYVRIRYTAFIRERSSMHRRWIRYGCFLTKLDGSRNKHIMMVMRCELEFILLWKLSTTLYTMSRWMEDYYEDGFGHRKIRDSPILLSLQLVKISYLTFSLF